MALAKDSLVRAVSRNSARAAQHRARSAARARAVFDDAAQVSESWANLTAWNAGANLQVSAGALFSAGGSGGASGANLALGLKANENLRAVFVINTKFGGSSGGIIVGFSGDAVGAAPTAAGAQARGLYIRCANSNHIQKWDNATATDLSTPGFPAAGGTYIATLVVDELFATITLRSADGSQEWRARWQRSAVNVNNLYVFNSDSRALTGASIGVVALKRGIATTTPRALVEGINATPVWSADGTNSFRVALPVNYDSRVGAPLAIMFHGHGSDETHYADNGNGKTVANALLAAGFIVVSAAYSPGVSTWGATNGLNAYVAAYQYAVANFAINGGVFLYGNSMGSIELWLTLASGAIPGVTAVAVSVPTASLAANYANAAFTATIRTAYGIASDGSDYAAKTAGHDPLLLDPRVFGSLPVLAIVATDDTTVIPAQNWDAFEPGIQATSPDYQRINVTGGHSSGSIGTNAPTIAAFAQKYAG
jgi:hypothetical protein